MRGTIASAALAAIVTMTPAQAQFRANCAEIAPGAGWLFPGDLARGPLGTALRTANAAVLAGSAAVGIAGPLSLYGAAAWADSDLEIGMPIVGGLSLTDARLLIFDVGVQLRSPGATAPLFQLGAGAMRYRVATGLVDVKADNAIVSAAAGMDVGLARGLSLRLLAKDYVGKFDTSDAILVDAPVRTAHNLAFTAGLRLAF
jgi:hypothetical protein